jgi:threonine synthase
MQFKNIRGFECTICGEKYGLHEVRYVCPKHGDDGILDVLIDLDYARRWISRTALAQNPDHSMWRYSPLLPVNPAYAARTVGRTILNSVGWTPLIPVPAKAARLGLGPVWIKDDGRQPTASFKDRASAIAVIKARESHCPIVTTASTGNAAAALAGLCAAVSQPNVIFVPRTAPEAKIAQLLVYGSTVFLVDGTYDDAFELCMKAASEFGWYNRNTGYNPYMSEGKKTAAYEICEQLDWQAPDYILVPVGDGCIIGGIHKGLREMVELGWIRKMPHLIGVQAEGSAALADAWLKGIPAAEINPIQARTIADSISAGLPRDRIKALRAVRESEGAFVTVSDDAIIAAVPSLARECGVFAEPAAAAAYAGLFQAVERGLIKPGKTAVVLSTGSGLKDPSAAVKAVGKPHEIPPDIAEVRRAMAQEIPSAGQNTFSLHEEGPND